ncbi:MAG: SDR family oxidoreductase, partial [Myxococcota bacterium]
RVYNLSRRPCPLEQVHNLNVDLSQTESVQAALQALHAQIEAPCKISLIHNAAIMLEDSIDNFDLDAFERALRINLTSPVTITSGLKPLMASGSSVIFIGSTLSDKGVPNRLNYVASKHAVVGLMRSLVQEFFGQKIHTVCVCPGFTATEMITGVLDENPDFKAQVLDMIAFHRLLEPAEVARCVAFAIDSPALNGSVLHANLGQRQA